jgi:IS5 family transposase
VGLLFGGGAAAPWGGGLKVATGTIVGAVLAMAGIINAPSSTKNADKARDPEMHQTKKGNQRYFGRKAHFGVDRRIKLIHTVVATPANVADSAVLPDLLHGKETRVWGDQTYRGQQAMILRHAPRAQDFINRRYRPSRRRGRDRAGERPPQVPDAGQEPALAKAGVEHPIGVIKRVLGFAKVRYRGLKKNARRLLVTYALANLSWHAGICCAARRARRVRTRPTYRADNAIRSQNGAAVPPCRSLRNSFCSHPRASLLFRRSLNRGIAPPSSSAK